MAKQAAVYAQLQDEVGGEQPTRAEGVELEEEFAGEAAASVRKMIEGFEDLGAPPGEEDSVAKMLDEYENGAERAEEDPQEYLTGRAFLEAGESASSLGLGKCSEM